MCEKSVIKAIDSHCHINYGPKDTWVHNYLSTTMQENEYYTAYWEQLLQMEKAAGIEKIIASPFTGVLDRNRAEGSNEAMFQLAQEIPQLYQWVVIDPENDNTFLQAERMLKHEKCVGIKLHPVCHQYAIEEYGDKIFSFAQQYSAIVQIHPHKRADYIVPFADTYHQVRFIMAHLGDKTYVDAVRNAKHGNVYVDTSGQASLKNMLIEYAVEKIGSEHILFGTDTYAASSQRGRIEFAMISPCDKENILRNNALHLFGV